MRYQIVDGEGTPIAEPFKSERLAYEAKRIYQDHGEDLALPLRIVPVDEHVEVPDLEEAERLRSVRRRDAA